MQQNILLVALLAGLSAATPSKIAARDNVSGYNPNLDVPYYKDCWNRWVAELKITGIPKPDGDETFTCRGSGHKDIQFWNVKYSGRTFGGNDLVSATTETRDQMWRSMDAKYENANYIVFRGLTGEYQRGVGYQTIS